MAETSDSDPTSQDKGKPRIDDIDLIDCCYDDQALETTETSASGLTEVDEPTIRDIFDMIDSYSDDIQTPMAEKSGSGLTSIRDMDSVDSFSVDQTDIKFKKMAERSCTSGLTRRDKGKAKVGEVPSSYFYYQTSEFQKIAERSASGLTTIRDIDSIDSYSVHQTDLELKKMVERGCSGFTRRDKGKAKVGEPNNSYFYYQTGEFEKIAEEKSASGNTTRDSYSVDHRKMAGTSVSRQDSYSVDQTREFQSMRQDNARAKVGYMDTIDSNFDDQIPKMKKLMADSINALGVTKGKDRISEVDWMDALLYTQVMAAIREPRMIKKSRLDEANEQVGDNLVIPEATRRTVAPPHTETNAPSGPGSRYYKTADICLSKSLTAHDVIKQGARLHLDVHEATILSDYPHIPYYRPGTFSDYIIVFDGVDRRYHMILSNYISGGRLQYAIDGEWPRFVRANNLKAGDEIYFYQVDPQNGNSKHYAIKHIRKPPDPPAHALKIGNKPNDDNQRDSKAGLYKLETMGKATDSLLLKFTKN